MQVGFELLRQEPDSRTQCERWARRFAKLDRANSVAIQLEAVSAPPRNPPHPHLPPLTPTLNLDPRTHPTLP